MERFEIFRILGVEETTDVSVLKRAYREKLSVTNPEDDPEGFKRLRSAYEEALRLAKEPKQEQTEEDTTLSGLWIRKVEKVYAHLSRRCNADEWKKLFREDVFLSLEEEENCSEKLLVFLMEHFRLPGEIWTLLDRQLGIKARAAKLREKFPADFISFLLARIEQGEEFEFELFEGEDDAPYDQYLQYYEGCWRCLDDEDYVRAKELYEAAAQLPVHHPAMEICHAKLLIWEEQTDQAIDLLYAELQKHPDNIILLFNTGEILWNLGGEQKAKAAKCYYRLKEKNDRHYMSNYRLTEWLYETGKYDEAKKCAEKVLTHGAQDEFIELLRKINQKLEEDLVTRWETQHKVETGLELCWCYLQDGRRTEGLNIALGLEAEIPAEKEAEWKGLIAKYYLELAEYEKAIAAAGAWEEALHRKIETDEDETEKERDIDRVRQSHMLRIQCFHNLGFTDSRYFEEAIRESESILEDKLSDLNILMEMAQIYIEMGEYEKCDEIVQKLIQEYQVYAAAASGMEACRRQLNASGVVQYATMCIRYFPDFEKAYEYLAKVYLDLEYPEKMEELVQAAEENGIHSDLLDAYVYLQDHEPYTSDELNDKVSEFRQLYRKKAEEGNGKAYETGLAVINDLLRHNPESFMFVERAIFHRCAHHYGEAEKDLVKALQLSPCNPYALNALSFVYRYQGKFDDALVFIRKAILYMTEDMSPIIYTDMAELYSLLGDYENALAVCLQYQKLTGEKSIWFLKQLAEVYVNLGNAAEACRIYSSYEEKNPWLRMDHCVDACIKCGDEEQARKYLKEWADGLGFKTTLMDRVKNAGKRFLPNADIGDNKEIIRYLVQALWTELIYGTAESTACVIRELMVYDEPIRSGEARLSDVTYACILCGDSVQGKKTAKKLQQLISLFEAEGNKKYFNSGKSYLELLLLASWYSKDEDTLAALLDSEAETEICHFCTSCVCRELEGMRILFLLRQGKRREAESRLRSNLKKQPSDEFMLAIKHMIFEQ